MLYSYIEAISVGFPAVQCHTLGDGSVYEDLVWDVGSPIPDKVTLDQWISSNIKGDENKKITILAFRKRFNLTEKITLEIASIDNPSATMQERQMAASLRVMMKDMETALFIDLDDPVTRGGVMVMEQYSLIGVGRSTEILDTPISDTERPTLVN